MRCVEKGASICIPGCELKDAKHGCHSVSAVQLPPGCATTSGLRQELGMCCDLLSVPIGHDPAHRYAHLQLSPTVLPRCNPVRQADGDPKTE